MFSIFKKKPKGPAPLPFETDIHCHLVPGVDDGAPTPEKAADLIERMQAWGIRRIIASPHVTQETFENTTETIEPALTALLHELSRRGNSIPVSHSAEYRIDELFGRRLAAGDLFLLPDSYILIENSYLQEPWNLDQLIFELQVKGLKPILVHPERYAYYSTRKNRYRDLHDQGVSFQINLLSLAGAYGTAEKKMAEYLLAQGLVDFMGTDLHRTSHADCIDRYLITSDAHSHLADAAAILQNNSVFPAAPGV